ncbi:probable serine/threonine-protein kinase PBL11 isoform X2 [Eucalyptus grandis]|uniref:probable serine/threonine-protein kinase PBL11 isoform X2 n=1 Tax=Eucalyptus grandis TaxID=71139 RepID=UPI00192F085A|nr:probable serine/threonine-protein kinase PBL11 isoform X2 [Eucalyptus grandis]
MVFNWHSPSSTDSDTESVANTGSCPFFPGTVLFAPFSQARTDSDTRSGGMGEKAEKRKRKLGLNSDQLGRKAMTGPPASQKALAKNPKVKRDALVGSKNKKAAASGSGKDEPPATAKVGEVITPYLKMYTLAELKSTTRNFRPDTMLGEDRFGRVFKGWVDERTLAPSEVGSGIPVAVKKSNLNGDQGLRQWQSEVKFLGKVSHPNLVRLLGYCWEDDHYLLVYEYMKRGSLENHLFKRKAGPLPWDVRLKIAIGAARGLEFLRTPENNVIYRDFKSSNILLDEDYNAKLSDFGLAKQGPVGGNSYVTTRAIEMDGYAAPEYSATSKTEILSAGDFGSVTTMLFRRLRDYLAEHLYVKNNVYRFGVILLEMLTGLQALDNTRPSGQQNLVEWARPLLHNKRKLRKIMDPRLEGRYPLEAATQAAGLTLKCLEDEPKARPSMDKVLATLEHINTIWEKKETKAGASSPPSSHQHHHNHH